MRKRCRPAFTMIELLAVIVITAILLALLLAGIQRVREAADRLRCHHNLRQLALAAHSFESARGRFPPGTIGPLVLPDGTAPADTMVGSRLSVLAILLPELGYPTLSQSIASVVEDSWNTNPDQPATVQ